jgi:hypothetical protein
MAEFEDFNDKIRQPVITQEMEEVEKELEKKTAEEEERLRKEMEVRVL